MHLKHKTWNPGTGNWNPHPLVYLPFIPFQCWCKCHHQKSLTSPGHHHTMLWWCHDLFWQESLHMCLVTPTEEVTLSGDRKVHAVVSPFAKGEMVAPGTYHDIYKECLSMFTVMPMPWFLCWQWGLMPILAMTPMLWWLHWCFECFDISVSSDTSKPILSTKL